METRFSNLFLGIRRAIALKMKLRDQREEAQRRPKTDRTGGRTRRTAGAAPSANASSRAIAAERPEARERLTADLWERLTEDERIDADLADTALPIDVLIGRLRRDLGLPPHWPGGVGPAGKADPKGGPAAGDNRGTSGRLPSARSRHGTVPIGSLASCGRRAGRGQLRPPCDVAAWRGPGRAPGPGA